MHAARFVLTPYYEIMDIIMPLRRLFLDESASLDTNGRLRGHQMVEFSVRYDHSLLLSESKRQKVESFNVRSVIRFCRVDEMRCDEYGIRVKDALPRHLNIDLNNTLISLPNLLPNDRSGKDGRRFPRPVDLTEGLIDNPIITNRMYLSWVQDESRRDEYYFAIYLVRLRSCEELTSLLLSQHISTVRTTLSLVYDQCVNLNGAVDDDLMLMNTSINMSLNCPVSRGRMKIPIRGQFCNHLQCFDCMTYLVMNFKKPTWLCPVCDKKTFFCYLEVDGLIFNIIKDERSKSVEQIQFNKSGQWKPMKMIPESNHDDSDYYDITDYIKQNEKEMSAKFTAAQTNNINTADNKVEQYLSQIIDLQKTNMPIENLKFPSKVIVTAITTTTNNYYGHMKANYTKSSNSTTIGNYSQSSMSQNVLHSSINLGRSSLPMSSSSMFGYCPTGTNNQIFPNRPPPPNYHNVRRTSSQFVPGNDGASRMPIVNDTPMNQNQRNDNVIVLSDDDDDDDGNDVILLTKASINKDKEAQKRPNMAANFPSDTSSSKKMKLTDSGSVTFTSRPQSASSMCYPTTPFSKLCSCSPGRMCPIHTSQLVFFNRMMAECDPTVTMPSSTTSSHCNNVPAHHHQSVKASSCHNKSSESLNSRYIVSAHSIAGTHYTESHNTLKARSLATSEFDHSLFTNRYMFGAGSREINQQSELGTRPVIVPVADNNQPQPSPNRATLSGTEATTAEERLRAQWMQLINNCPMPYTDKSTLSSNINNIARTQSTHTQPSHITSSINAGNSYANTTNIFYND